MAPCFKFYALWTILAYLGFVHSSANDSRRLSFRAPRNQRKTRSSDSLKEQPGEKSQDRLASSAKMTREGILELPDIQDLQLSASVSMTGPPSGRRTMNEKKKGRIYHVVLTGGPCAGKTTSLSKITATFTTLGWQVLCVPEVATFLLNGGVNFNMLSTKSACDFQANLLDTMLQVEKTYRDLANAYAESGRDCLLVSDRGALDPSTFVEKDDWIQILKKRSLDDVSVRDHYDLVIHLETAALGAEHSYNLGNNSCRRESARWARIRDRQLKMAWMGHPRHVVIDNSTDFDTKLQRTIGTIFDNLGIPDPRGAQTQRYLFHVEVITTPTEPSTLRHFEVEQHILLGNDDASLRKRGTAESFIYTLSMRNAEVDGQRVEIRRNINLREYEELLNRADPAFEPIRTRQLCLMWKNRSYQLDYFSDHRHAGLILMETNLPLADPQAQDEQWWQPYIPPFVRVIADVSNTHDYSLKGLAHRPPEK